MAEKQHINAILHLELRGRGRPGKPSKTTQVYSSEFDADPDDPHWLRLTLVRTGESFGGSVFESSRRFWVSEYDPETRTATYRESIQKSDRLADELEFYGWKRRRDLEDDPAVKPELREDREGT